MFPLIVSLTEYFYFYFFWRYRFYFLLTQVSTALFKQEIKMAENTMTNIFFSSFTEKMLLHFIFVVEFASKISSRHTQILRRFETWGRPGIKSCWNNAYHQGKNPHIIIFFVKTQGDIGRSLHFHDFVLQCCYSYFFRPLLMFWSPN